MHINNLKFSVMLNIGNNEEYLKSCLDSIYKQRLNEIEIIFILSKSNNNLQKILDKYNEQNSKITITTLNESELKSNNYLDKLSGEFVYISNSNDWLEPNCFEEAYYEAKLYDSDIILFDFKEYSNEKYIGDFQYLKQYTEFNTNDFTFNENESILFEKKPSLCSKIYKTSFLKENNINYLKNQFTNDAYFNIETLLLAKHISYIPKNLCNHRNFIPIKDLQDEINEKKYLSLFYEYDEIQEILNKTKHYDKFEVKFITFMLNTLEIYLNKLNKLYKDSFLKLINQYFKKIDISPDIFKKIPFKNYKFFIHVINSKTYSEFETFYKFKTNVETNLEDKETIEKNEIGQLILNDLTNGYYTNIQAFTKIKQFNLFDEQFYRQEYGFSLDIDPILHYIYKGYKKNRKPHPLFDRNYYSKSNENVSKSNLDPFIYFALYGLDEGKIKINKDAPQPGGIINKKKLDVEIINFRKFGVNNTNTPNIIVSLTSFPERMYDIHFVLYSLLTQSFKPSSVVLWLAESQFPHKEKDIPQKVLSLKENGLEIKWCENLGSFKKLIPSLSEYPNDIIVTADDDIYYPNHWLNELYRFHIKYPNDIISHRARHIKLNENNTIKKYAEWELCLGEYQSSFLNFATNGAGSLIPPNSYDKEILNYNLAEKLCSSTDDIWFWAMSVLNHTKTHVVENNMPWLTYVNPARDFNILNEKTLWSINSQGKNDENLNKILHHFPKILDIIIENE